MNLLPLSVGATILPLAMWGAGVENVVLEKLSGKTTGKDWSLSSKMWKVSGGALQGTGEGHLAYDKSVSGDFVLSFEAKTEEKANIEVHLVDKKGKPVFAFAFLGQYHSALDGVKCCILKENRFVNVNSRMWIYPGRSFKFEIRRAKNQYQMFLNRELGPFFVDSAPPKNVADLRLRIIYSPEGKRDKLRLDNVRLEVKS